MGFSKENYGYVEGLLAKRRQESELRSRERTLEVYARCPELKEVDRRLSGS